MPAQAHCLNLCRHQTSCDGYAYVVHDFICFIFVRCSIPDKQACSPVSGRGLVLSY